MNASASLKTLNRLPCKASQIVDAVVIQHQRRWLLFGQPGAGKTTLARALGSELHARGLACQCISADPGSPGFGIPGAVMLGKWDLNDWQLQRYSPLCTLDAGRFRLPLVSAVQRLAQAVDSDVLLLDGPGVVRGAPGRELLQGIVAAADIDAVLAITLPHAEPPLLDELQSLGCQLYVVQSATEAKRPGQRARARERTRQWENYLAGGTSQSLELGKMKLTGTPPPIAEASAWTGRQVAISQQQQTCAMGEVIRLDGQHLVLSLPPGTHSGDTLLVRDAARSADGLLETAEPYLAERIGYLPPVDVMPTMEKSGGPRVAGRVGTVDVALLNGVFGDPMLHARIRHLGRSLLFDIGDGARLPARLAHQVSDIFISHAHMDHISGFQWFLRSRLVALPACRLYGPPGLARHIDGLIAGFLWDRIEDNAPIFLISELHGEELRCFRIVVGKECELIKVSPVSKGVILAETGFRIRAVVLDHHTPVLAYALEEEKTFNVRKDKLSALELETGPWLTTLKEMVLKGKRDRVVTLPDGSARNAGALADELLLVTPGKKLVYATDLGDTPKNRRSLVALAERAHTLFCEATFCEADAEFAKSTGHLTARACGEIAAEAGVARLIPFHFSRRYGDDPQQLYEEVGNACSCLVSPSPKLFSAPGME